MAATPDPVERYLETFDRLRARKRWSTDTDTIRFVALALGAAGRRGGPRRPGAGGEGPAPAGALDQPAQVADSLRGRGDDPAAGARPGGDPRAGVRGARRVQGARTPEPRHRSDAGRPPARAAQRGTCSAATARRAACRHLPPLAQGPLLADGRHRPPRRGAARGPGRSRSTWSPPTWSAPTSACGRPAFGGATRCSSSRTCWPSIRGARIPRCSASRSWSPSG